MSDLSIEPQILDTIEEQRQSQRSRTFRGARIIVDKNSTFDCQIKSCSDSGFGLKLGSTSGVPDEFKLIDQKSDLAYDVKVVWRKRSMLGVQIVA